MEKNPLRWIRIGVRKFIHLIIRHLYDLMNAVGALKDNRIEGLYIARGESLEAELLRFYKSVKMYYRFHCVA